MKSGNTIPKLLIVDQKQFGYHNSTYYMVKYLQNRYNITYFGWNNSLPNLEAGNSKVIHLTKSGILPLRFLTFLKCLILEIKTFSPDILFLNYFHGVFLLRILFPRKLMMLDIRTGSVKKTFLQRLFSDSMLRFDAIFFKNITIISESLAKRLNIHQSRYFVLPLGAEIISSMAKQFDSIDLLYVGTMNNRRIEDTINGFLLFRQKFPGARASYHIIGGGKAKYMSIVQKSIQDGKNSDLIYYHGIVPHDQLKSYFDQCNVGVSYIPKNKYFDCQPPTKTIEFLMSGMVVIGTSTYENCQLLSEKNSVLINDDALSFAGGLEKLYLNRKNFFSDDIRSEALIHKWENIISGKLLFYFESQKI